jgi:hypothetical protein
VAGLSVAGPAGSPAVEVMPLAAGWPKSLPQPPQNRVLVLRCRPHFGQKLIPLRRLPMNRGSSRASPFRPPFGRALPIRWQFRASGYQEDYS